MSESRLGRPNPTAAERGTFVSSGLAVGGWAAWLAWWFVSEQDDWLVGASLVGLAALGGLAIWWGVRGR